jgi:hypothetical protein
VAKRLCQAPYGGRNRLNVGNASGQLVVQGFMAATCSNTFLRSSGVRRAFAHHADGFRPDMWEPSLGRSKACFLPPPRPRVSPAGPFPGWPDSSARQAGPARGQSGPGRTRGDAGENRPPRVLAADWDGGGGWAASPSAPSRRRTASGSVTVRRGPAQRGQTTTSIANTRRSNVAHGSHPGDRGPRGRPAPRGHEGRQPLE